MGAATKKRVAINLIAGPLGVGKTTTINHLLAQRPTNERWAVLVNEYGLVGLDAALMEQASEPGFPKGIDIREVAGGCICCSAGFMFEMSLVLLLQKKPDRLIIEPTGLAALSGILDVLERPGIREYVDVRSIICLLDPGRRGSDLRREEVQDQIAAADILVANRSDLATKKQLAAFQSWADSLFPPKRFIGSIRKGELAYELLDRVKDRREAAPRGGHRHGTDHGGKRPSASSAVHAHPHDHSEVSPADQLFVCDASQPMVQRAHRSHQTSTLGWICWDALIFDAKRVSCWLSEVSRLPGARRTKAVLRTNEGWWGFNFADGIEEVRPSGYRRDSRLELVIESSQFPDDKALEQGLRQCLVADSLSRFQNSAILG